MKHFTVPLYIFIFSFICNFTSCEYDSDSFYYEEIRLPKETEIGINLADISPEETIYIYTKTKLYYSLNTFGKELLAQDFSFEGGKVNKVGNYIYLTPQSGEERKYKLEVNVSLKSHTGSISDIVGVESFIGKYTYYVQFIDNDLKLDLKQDVTEDKYFKLVWENPNLQQTPVDYYEVIFENIKGEPQSIRIDDSNKTYYIDNSYAYGYRVYTVKTHFKGDRIAPWTDNYTAQYRSLTESDFRIGEYDNRNVLVSWIPNDFKCKYYITFPDNYPVTHHSTSSYSLLSRPPFPVVNAPANVYILPESATYSDYTHVSPVKVNISSNKLGSMMYGYAASKEDDLIFGFTDNQLICFDSNLNTIRSKAVSGITSFSNISVTPSNPDAFPTKVATHNGNGKAFIFNYDKTNRIWDNEGLSFDIPLTSTKYNLFSLTTNNRLYLSNTYLGNHSMNVYNSLTGELLHEGIPLSINSKVDVSPNGQYVCEVTPQKVILYEFWINKNNIPIYTKNNEWNNSSTAYTNCKFNPNNPSQIILTSNSSFCKLNLYPTSFEDAISGHFINFDPFTGYILYSDVNYIGNHSIRIMDLNISGDVWQMTVNPLYINKDIYLYNSNVIIDSYYTNVSNLYWK